MNKVMKSSKCIFMVLVIIITFYAGSIAYKQHEYDVAKLNNIMSQVDKNYSNILNHLYFSVDIVEQISKQNYSNTSKQALDDMFEVIIDEFKYRSIGILPNGILEYIYPLEGNEQVIGDDVLMVPSMSNEVKIAIETKDVIMSGPYELVKGGEAFVMRKAVFIEDKFWGFIAIVIDKDILLEEINLQVFNDANYKYQFSAVVNSENKIIIDEVDGFNEKNAKWNKIGLANGYWELGINLHTNNRYLVAFFMILAMGYIIAFMIAYSVERIERKLKYIKKEVFIDKLTGVNNRKCLDEIQELFTNNNTKYTVIYIDLNKFKFINDTYGHNIGDEALVIFTEKLKSVVRETDYIIRMGGDEFVIILPNTYNKSDVDRFCDRLNRMSIQIGSITKEIKFTYGYDICISNDKILSQIIDNADKNMYIMKNEKNINFTTKLAMKPLELVTK